MTPAISFRIPRSLWIHEFSDPDSSRYCLGAMQFDFSQGLVHCTDGRIAIRVKCDALREQSGRPNLLLNASAIGTALKFARSAKIVQKCLQLHLVTNDWESFGLSVRDYTTERAIVPWERFEGKYPDVDSVFEMSGSRSHMVVPLNRNLLSVICRFANTCLDADSRGVRMTVTEGANPIRVCLEGKLDTDNQPIDAEIIMMPMELDELVGVKLVMGGEGSA